MSNPKAPQHTSKRLTKDSFLPPLQKKIFLHLASSDPKTINEIVKEIKGHYKSCWNAFNQLEKKKLLKTVSSKAYHGQEYPRYWISEDGAIIALCEGAKANSLLKRTLEIYPERRDLHYLMEIVPILGTHAFNIAYFAIVSKGKLEECDKAAMMAAQMQNKLSPEQIKQFNKVLLKYPEQQQKFTDFFKEMSESIRNLDALLKQAKSEESKRRA